MAICGLYSSFTRLFVVRSISFFFVFDVGRIHAYAHATHSDNFAFELTSAREHSRLGLFTISEIIKPLFVAVMCLMFRETIIAFRIDSTDCILNLL